jgi:hypothetical protein
LSAGGDSHLKKEIGWRREREVDDGAMIWRKERKRDKRRLFYLKVAAPLP